MATNVVGPHMAHMATWGPHGGAAGRITGGRNAGRPDGGRTDAIGHATLQYLHARCESMHILWRMRCM